MADTTTGIDALPHAHREPVLDFADLVRNLAGKNAQSLTLFGAIAAGSFDERRHTIRSVLVLETVELDLLRALAEHGKKLGKAKIAAPLIMTADYIRESLDTFPLELIEIHQNHLTLFGDDHFADLAFRDDHIRLQCEREFKTLLIGLRQGLLTAAGRDRVLNAIEMDVAEALLRTLRGLLWLKGTQEAKPASELLAAVEKLVGQSLPGVRTALEPDGDHGWYTFQSLYRDVEKLSEIANAW